jgi:hypothetical protein
MIEAGGQCLLRVRMDVRIAPEDRPRMTSPTRENSQRAESGISGNGVKSPDPTQFASVSRKSLRRASSLRAAGRSSVENTTLRIAQTAPTQLPANYYLGLTVSHM